MQQKCLRKFSAVALGLVGASTAVAAVPPGPLYTPAASFNFTDKIVSATVFHWFGADNGQQTGPWRPLEGRPAWDGGVDFWKRQIKDIMDANIQVMYVHLMNDPAHEQRRVNMFQAAGELRAQGYNVPKIAPFLDPAVIYPTSNPPTIDLATQAGKNDFVGHYKRFYEQYYSVNTDANASDYIAKIGNKPVLNTWHILPEQIANRTSLSRADVESRLSDDAWAHHAAFESGVYMVGTGLNNTYPTFVDERLVQFETHDYYRTVVYDPPGSPPSVRTAQVKAGYWDQNIPEWFRSPDSFIPRAGGTNYANAWNSAVNQSGLLRINVESWNEYDEGSGIFEGNPGPPFIHPENEDSNTDTWSNTNNPREYIDTTAAGARIFNGIADLDAKGLWDNFPTKMYAGTKRNISVVVRNEGDLQWTAAQNIKFGQKEIEPGEVMFGPGRYLMDDTQDDIPKYGGIFRGRPKQFDFSIIAPGVGTYNTHWQMVQEGVAWFGEMRTAPIQVLAPFYGDTDVDSDVDVGDLGNLAANWRTRSGADWLMGDFNADGDVDHNDLALLKANYPGGAAAAQQAFDSLVPHWTFNGTGNWLTPSNWSTGVRNGVDVTATFGSVISANRLVSTASSITLGTLTFNSPQTYLFAGLGSLTMQVSDGSALIEVFQGTHKINVPLIIASNTELSISSGATLVIADPFTVNAGKTLSKTGSGTVAYQSIVTIAGGANLEVAGSAHFAGLALIANAKADVSGSLTINGGDYDDITSKVKQGLNGGDWKGNGITSSAAANDPNGATALGTADSDDGVMVKYTYYGDTNLDGSVGLEDFEQFVIGKDIGHADWTAGDFDYNGAIGASDFHLFLRGLVNQGRNIYTPELYAALSSFASSEGLSVDLSAVPEPSAMGLLGLAAWGLLRHRRNQ